MPSLSRRDGYFRLEFQALCLRLPSAHLFLNDRQLHFLRGFFQDLSLLLASY
jgi:hypothetical protein